MSFGSRTDTLFEEALGSFCLGKVRLRVSRIVEVPRHRPFQFLRLGSAVPPHTVSVIMQDNSWPGVIPSLWWYASNLAVLDLSECGVTGPLLNLIPFIVKCILLEPG